MDMAVMATDMVMEVMDTVIILRKNLMGDGKMVGDFLKILGRCGSEVEVEVEIEIFKCLKVEKYIVN